jgi:hypothetical protein
MAGQGRGEAPQDIQFGQGAGCGQAVDALGEKSKDRKIGDRKMPEVTDGNGTRTGLAGTKEGNHESNESHE